MNVNLDRNNPAFGNSYIQPGLLRGKRYKFLSEAYGLSDRYIKSISESMPFDVYVIFKQAFMKMGYAALENMGFDVYVCDAGVSPKTYDSLSGVKKEVRLADIGPETSLPDALNRTVNAAIDGFFNLKKIDNFLQKYMSKKENHDLDAVRLVFVPFEPSKNQ